MIDSLICFSILTYLMYYLMQLVILHLSLHLLPHLLGMAALSVLMKEISSPTSTTPLMGYSVEMKENLRSVLEAGMEVCVTLAGMKQLPRLCVVIGLVPIMVCC